MVRFLFSKTAFFTIVLLLFVTSVSFAKNKLKPIVLDPSYEHNRFGTMPRDIIREFRAFTVSFDSEDSNNKGDATDSWRIPEWVSYVIKKYTDGECIPTGERPSKWLTEEDLFEKGIAPDDDSYAYKKPWRNNNPDWYVRGHLCMKLIAERLGNDAAYNTHTVLNAVPQRSNFNEGIWLDLEYSTAAWAQRYGAVWVITGPIIIDGTPSGWIGEKGDLPVAIPDALFKIVVKDAENSEIPDVLAFIYPQVGINYKEGPFHHEYFLTSVDEIEELTRLDFFTIYPEDVQSTFEGKTASALWEAGKEDFIKPCRE